MWEPKNTLPGLDINGQDGPSLTDGPNNEVQIGRRSIHFKHARPKAMAGLQGKFALVVQALRHLGKESVGTREIEALRAKLSPQEKR